MEISVIASGSNGNSCLVEDKGCSLLLDAGKSCKEAEFRLNKLGKSLEHIDAILLTHSHTDHISGAGAISRKYNIPIYMTSTVYNESKFKLGDIVYRYFDLRRPFKIKKLEIKPIHTSHSVSSCGFKIGKFGIFTDTGIVTKQMEDAMPKLKGVLLESNHDIDMLINGPYPYYLKTWILSNEGHLSNVHASSFIQEKGSNLALALLGHLSGNNNTPDIAKTAFETIVKRKIDYSVCSREKVSGTWSI
jgi:phosphoribosyl 1,2-cyclic phosphodiesterase